MSRKFFSCHYSVAFRLYFVAFRW